MGSAVRLILLSSGLWALALCTLRRFYVVEDKKNWTEAQKYCREHYTDLATFENEEEMDAVKDVRNETQGNAWIGLRQVNSNSWFWSDETPKNNYTNWSTGEPSGPYTDYNCVEIYPNNTWNDAGCKWNNSFICYKRQIPLIVIKQKTTWREALRFCRQNHVDLVSVDSKEMQDWVETVTKNVTSDLWVGLRHTCVLGIWYWVSGEMICYQNWAPGNGTGAEDCSVVERTGALLAGSKKWVSLPETDQLFFLCITFF